MYKDKTREWGFMKNIKGQLARRIWYEVRKRGDRPTEVFWRGMPVPMSRVKKVFERQFGSWNTTELGSGKSYPFIRHCARRN